MAIQILDPGGEFYYSLGPTAPGMWASTNGSVSIVPNAPVGRATQYALAMNGSAWMRKILPANYVSVIVGGAYFMSPTFSAGTLLFVFFDGNNSQCDVRVDATGHLYATNNGTVLGTSTNQLIVGSGWHYIEAQPTIGNSVGAFSIWVDNVNWLAVTAVDTQATGNAYTNLVYFGSTGSSGNSYWKDIYILDTLTGVNRARLGDMSVILSYPSGVGVNSAWSATGSTGTTITNVANGVGFNVPVVNATVLSSVGYTPGNTVTITGASYFNGTWTLIGAAANVLTWIDSSLSDTLPAITTGSVSDSPVLAIQDGANHQGTWPDGDTSYIYDSVPGDISDFAHTPLTVSGVIYGVMHMSYMRKDDSGSRTVSQMCLSNTILETSAPISLGSSYSYYQDVLETNPFSGLNFATSQINVTAGVVTVYGSGTVPPPGLIAGANLYVWGTSISDGGPFVLTTTGMSVPGVQWFAIFNNSAAVGSGTSAVSATVSTTPGPAWTVSTYNAATFGIKELS